MKEYPSIIRFTKEKIDLHTFDKLDGSCLRFEFSKKRGWYKFGTRTRLFDESDQQFGEALPLFYKTIAEPIGKICTDQKWEKTVVFAEFWGKESFAGCHVDGDPKQLTVIDVSPHQRGILPPREFLKLFGEFGPYYLGELRWNLEFVECIKANSIEGVTFEGVVGKTAIKKNILMYKAKTQQWIDKVKSRFNQQQAIELLNS